jgi:hypothetical protein
MEIFREFRTRRPSPSATSALSRRNKKQLNPVHFFGARSINLRSIRIFHRVGAVHDGVACVLCLFGLVRCWPRYPAAFSEMLLVVLGLWTKLPSDERMLYLRSKIRRGGSSSSDGITVTRPRLVASTQASDLEANGPHIFWLSKNSAYGIANLHCVLIVRKRFGCSAAQ